MINIIKIYFEFRVEFVVVEFFIVDFVVFDWGVDGFLWVVEMGDYFLGCNGFGGRVCVLWDIDFDGCYDYLFVFFDGFLFLIGVKVWWDGVIVFIVLLIFYVIDWDGDDVVD